MIDRPTINAFIDGYWIICPYARCSIRLKRVNDLFLFAAWREKANEFAI